MNGENDELPEGWACTRLGDLVSPSSEKVEPTEQAKTADTPKGLRSRRFRTPKS